MSWMDVALFTTVKVFIDKLRPFEYAQSMSKWPAGLVYVGNNCGVDLSSNTSENSV